MPTFPAVLRVVLWPGFAFALLCAGTVAYCASVTSGPYCECGCVETLSDGECLECALPTPRGCQ